MTPEEENDYGVWRIAEGLVYAHRMALRTFEEYELESVHPMLGDLLRGKRDFWLGIQGQFKP